MTTSYKIRRYEPADRDGFLSLFEEVLGAEMGSGWFTWKYEMNPYADRIPLLIAEHDGEMVGARAFLPLEIKAGDDSYEAFQPCDSMVHPDHQRQGLFTRMTERAIESYDDIDVFFNFPNHRSLPGNLALGWQVVDTRETYYRIQNPTAWLSQSKPIETLARSVARGYCATKDRFADSNDEFELAWYEGVPASLLASLAESKPIPEFHVRRDERFYQWRFDNPHWSYRTVVATRAGTPVGAAIFGRRNRTSGPSIARILDVIPFSNGTNSVRSDAVSVIFDGIVQQCEGVDIVIAPGEVVPRRILTARGFHSDKRAPLRWISSPSTHVVRPSGENPSDWTLSGRQLTDESNWRLALCEIDSG